MKYKRKINIIFQIHIVEAHLKMEHKQPHISIYHNNRGDTMIVIDDYELFDFIEDYLIENYDIKYDQMVDLGNNCYEMNFGKGYSFEQLKEVILKIDKAEIERIYILNN